MVRRNAPRFKPDPPAEVSFLTCAGPLPRGGARCAHTFEAVRAEAVNATKRIDHPGTARGGWAEGAPGLPWPQPANQMPGPRQETFCTRVRLHGAHLGASMRSLVALV